MREDGFKNGRFRAFVIISRIAIATIGLFLMVQQGSAQRSAIAVKPSPPRIVSFQINNGAAVTTSDDVTLNNVVEGAVSDYRVAWRYEDLATARWFPYSNVPSYRLVRLAGEYSMLNDGTKVWRCRIFFQVRYKPERRAFMKIPEDLVSAQVVDEIEYHAPPREYQIPFGDACHTAARNGWTNLGVAQDINSDCFVHIQPGGPVVIQTFGKKIPVIGGTYGAKANFVLFGGGKRLAPFWKFKRVTLNDQGCNGLHGQKNGYTTQIPPADGDSVTISIHSWCEGNHICELIFGTLVLWGPDGDYTDAFR